ncbi:CPBP family intramembrane glutamic endopeptidase [Nonomuraea sp. NPDC048826]|uniref:CPBP family intramembrane glutamic endopeptidase n=1 Tax=Nonomuraea sp. NPDC048826 TaxID=3364347 RepID=UPI00372066DC
MKGDVAKVSVVGGVWRIGVALAVPTAAFLLGRDAGLWGAAAAVTWVTVTVAALAWPADRRRLADLGLTGLPLLVAGALAWLLPAAAALAVAAACGVPAVATAPVTTALVAAVLFGFAEELVFRGYVITVLADRVRGWAVILGQAALYTGFGLALGNGEPWLMFGLGVGLGYLRMITGSVWAGAGFHAAFLTMTQVFPAHPWAVVVLGAVPCAAGIVFMERLMRSRLLARTRQPAGR